MDTGNYMANQMDSLIENGLHQMDDFITDLDNRIEESGWVAVTDALPKPLQTVWLTNGKGWVSLGCRAESDGGWHWAESNGVIYIENFTEVINRITKRYFTRMGTLIKKRLFVKH